MDGGVPVAEAGAEAVPVAEAGAVPVPLPVLEEKSTIIDDLIQFLDTTDRDVITVSSHGVYAQTPSEERVPENCFLIETALQEEIVFISSFPYLNSLFTTPIQLMNILTREFSVTERINSFTINHISMEILERLFASVYTKTHKVSYPSAGVGGAVGGAVPAMLAENEVDTSNVAKASKLAKEAANGETYLHKINLIFFIWYYIQGEQPIETVATLLTSPIVYDLPYRWNLPSETKQIREHIDRLLTEGSSMNQGDTFSTILHGTVSDTEFAPSLLTFCMSEIGKLIRNIIFYGDYERLYSYFGDAYNETELERLENAITACTIYPSQSKYYNRNLNVYAKDGSVEYWAGIKSDSGTNMSEAEEALADTTDMNAIIETCHTAGKNILFLFESCGSKGQKDKLLDEKILTLQNTMRLAFNENRVSTVGPDILGKELQACYEVYVTTETSDIGDTYITIKANESTCPKRHTMHYPTTINQNSYFTRKGKTSADFILDSKRVLLFRSDPTTLPTLISLHSDSMQNNNSNENNANIDTYKIDTNVKDTIDKLFTMSSIKISHSFFMDLKHGYDYTNYYISTYKNSEDIVTPILVNMIYPFIKYIRKNDEPHDDISMQLYTFIESDTSGTTEIIFNKWIKEYAYRILERGVKIEVEVLKARQAAEAEAGAGAGATGGATGAGATGGATGGSTGGAGAIEAEGEGAIEAELTVDSAKKILATAHTTFKKYLNPSTTDLAEKKALSSINYIIRTIEAAGEYAARKARERGEPFQGVVKREVSECIEPIQLGYDSSPYAVEELEFYIGKDQLKDILDLAGKRAEALTLLQEIARSKAEEADTDAEACEEIPNFYDFIQRFSIGYDIKVPLALNDTITMLRRVCSTIKTTLGSISLINTDRWRDGIRSWDTFKQLVFKLYKTIELIYQATQNTSEPLQKTTLPQDTSINTTAYNPNPALFAKMMVTPSESGTISNTIREFLTNKNAAKLSQTSRGIQGTLVFEKKIANEIITLCRESKYNVSQICDDLFQLGLPFSIDKGVDAIFKETQELLCGGLLVEDLVDHSDIFEEIYVTKVNEQFEKNIDIMQLLADEVRSIKNMLDPMFQKAAGGVGGAGGAGGKRTVKRNKTRKRSIPPARKTKKRKLKPCLTRKK